MRKKMCFVCMGYFTVQTRHSLQIKLKLFFFLFAASKAKSYCGNFLGFLVDATFGCELFNLLLTLFTTLILCEVKGFQTRNLIRKHLLFNLPAQEQNNNVLNIYHNCKRSIITLEHSFNLSVI